MSKDSKMPVDYSSSKEERFAGDTTVRATAGRWNVADMTPGASIGTDVITTGGEENSCDILKTASLYVHALKSAGMEFPNFLSSDGVRNRGATRRSLSLNSSTSTPTGAGENATATALRQWVTEMKGYPSGNDGFPEESWERGTCFPNFVFNKHCTACRCRARLRNDPINVRTSTLGKGVKTRGSGFSFMSVKGYADEGKNSE